MAIDVERLITLLVGGGGIVGIISALLTRQTSKEANEFNLLDRTQKELIRKDEKVNRLEAEKRALEKKFDEKEDELRHSEFERKKLLNELERVITELERVKAEAELLRKRIRQLEREGEIT